MKFGYSWFAESYFISGKSGGQKNVSFLIGMFLSNEVIEAKIFLSKKPNSNQLKNHLESFEHLLGLFLGISRTKEKATEYLGKDMENSYFRF